MLSYPHQLKNALIGADYPMFLPENSLLDQLSGHIGWKDLNRHYIGANKSLLEFKGFRDIEEITGKTDEELAPSATENNRIFQEQDLRVFNGEKLTSIHFDKDCNEIYILDKSPLLDKNKDISGLIYHCRPYQLNDVFKKLKQFDDDVHLNPAHYALNSSHNHFDLTSRECECIFLLIRGKTAKEIGTILSLSKRTIEAYIENIKNKMDCKNKAEILVKAILNGYHSHVPARFNNTAYINSL